MRILFLITLFLAISANAKIIFIEVYVGPQAGTLVNYTFDPKFKVWEVRNYAASQLDLGLNPTLYALYKAGPKGLIKLDNMKSISQYGDDPDASVQFQLWQDVPATKSTANPSCPSK